MFYWIKTHSIIKWLFRNQIWSIKNNENKIYLTFDDGPTPKVTEWVLDLLLAENIKATFFCIGENIQKNPEIFKRIVNEGHSVGNHTYNHVLGWKKSTEAYLENVEDCRLMIDDLRFQKLEKLIEDGNLELRNQNLESKIVNQKSLIKNLKSKLFRPPYGKITPSQSKALRKLGYKIIMWDVLTADFDTTISPEQCLKNATEKVTSGSIIVFHDSEKTFKNLEYALPRAIEYYKKEKYNFEKII